MFDPTGGGLDDIAQRRIVFVGDPETRIREDYLRILRFFRFFAWYGRGEPDAAGLAACSKLKAGLAAISAERIWMEMKKLLSAPSPMAALDAMGSFGVLTTLFPNTRGLELLAKIVGLEGTGRAQRPIRWSGSSHSSGRTPARFTRPPTASRCRTRNAIA